jgi:hypothetical protein
MTAGWASTSTWPSSCALYHAFDEKREITYADLWTAVGRQVPLSSSQREDVDRLRSWLAEGRAVSASACPAAPAGTGRPVAQSPAPRSTA